MDTAVGQSTLPPAATKQAWAPGVVAMTAWTGLTVLFMGLPSQVGYARFIGVESEAVRLAIQVASVALWIGCAIAAHNAYTRAAKALAGNPGLRGHWLVRNLWWVAALAIALPFLAAFAWMMVRFYVP